MAEEKDLKKVELESKLDFEFIEQHKKAIGETAAKKLLEVAKSMSLPKPKMQKVYINIYGAEVHVNGPVVEPVSKPETLQEKIARFARLAANVRANRALMMNLRQDFDDEDESEEDAEKAMEKVDSVDEFGEPYTLEDYIAEKESGKAATDNIGSPAVIDGDEPSQAAAPSAADIAKQSDMLEDEK